MKRTFYSRAFLFFLTLGTTVAFLSVALEKSPAQTAKKERILARKSPLVLAVADASRSVVSIQGEKQYDASNAKKVPTSSNRGTSPDKENTTHIGMGSGVVVDERGYILTNNHVVKDLLKIQVITNDETVYRDVEFIRNDVATDLALLKINPAEPLQKIKFGNSSELLLGEDVYAIGNPYGLQGSVTRGIVSGLNRPLKSSETISYENVIQTDAAINPGNSGGPLINIDGEMVGLNAAVREDAQNIAFVIPVDVVKDVLNRMLTQSVAKMTHHGLEFRSIDVDSPEYPFDSDRGEYLFVESVHPRSPGFSAGLQPGDVLLVANHYEIHSVLDFTRSLIDVSLTDSVPLEIYRGGKEMESNLAFSNLANKSETLAAKNLRPLRLESESSSLGKLDDVSLKGEKTENDSTANLSSAETFPSYGASPEKSLHASLVSEISGDPASSETLKSERVRQFFGVEVQNISLDEYQRRFPNLTVVSIGSLNIIPSGGVLIKSVEENGRFHSANGSTQVGDVIFGFVVGESEEDQLGVTSLDHLYYIAQKWDEYAARSPNRQAKIYLIRDDKPYFLEIDMNAAVK